MIAFQANGAGSNPARRSKRCFTCDELKELRFFNKSNKTKDGHQRDCKSCRYDKNYRDWPVKSRTEEIILDLHFINERITVTVLEEKRPRKALGKNDEKIWKELGR
jgi:hypothetical protein